MKLTGLLNDISYRLVGNRADLEQEITCVTARVERVTAKTLFVCTQTALSDGYRSAATAYGLGCRAFLCAHTLDLPQDALILIVPDPEALLGVLAHRCLGEPARGMTVLGVTGTVGKSSVVHTLTAILLRSGRRAASISTDGVQIGRQRRIAPAIVPDAGEIAALLHEFAASGVEIAVAELSAYQLSHKAAFFIPFAAVLMTNLMPAHIGNGEFEDFAAYREAKLSLMRSGAPFKVLPAGIALPIDGRTVTFGEGGDFSAEIVKECVGKRGYATRFWLRAPHGEKTLITLPVPGGFAVQNALAVAALARIVGLDMGEIARGLCRVQPKGRMQCVAAFDGCFSYVDSAFEPDDVARALEVLRARTTGKLTLVIGSVGGRAKWRRAPLGRVAVEHADFAYFTADDPDCEPVENICHDMLTESDPARACVVVDRRKAIARAVRELRPGDTLLIAGKGGCETQLIYGEKQRFSDKETVEETVLLL